MNPEIKNFVETYGYKKPHQQTIKEYMKNKKLQNEKCNTKNSTKILK